MIAAASRWAAEYIVPAGLKSIETTAAYQSYLHDTLIFGAVLFCIGLAGGYIIRWRIEHLPELQMQIYRLKEAIKTRKGRLQHGP